MSEPTRSHTSEQCRIESSTLPTEMGRVNNASGEWHSVDVSPARYKDVRTGSASSWLRALNVRVRAEHRVALLRGDDERPHPARTR